MTAKRLSKRAVILIICAAVLCAVLLILFFPRIVFFTKNYDIRNRCLGVNYTETEDGTHFDIDMVRGCTMLLGREIWQAGDKIDFQVSVPEDCEVEVTIIPTLPLEISPEYHSYGLPVAPTTVALQADEAQNVTVTVPETGEYGIYLLLVRESDSIPLAYFDLLTVRTVPVVLDVDRLFVNPI